MSTCIKKIVIVVMILTGILSFCSSMYFFSSSLYIHAKAQLAQILLNGAWDKTLLHQKNIRPWPSADYFPFAALSVPSSQDKMIVLSNASGQSLSFGPGFHEESSYPGENGRTIISMHVDTHGRFLKSIKKGDIFHLQTKEGLNLLYTVNSMKVIDSSKTKLRIDSTDHELILYTCYPFDAVRPGGSQRYVVQALLLNNSKNVKL